MSAHYPVPEVSLECDDWRAADLTEPALYEALLHGIGACVPLDQRAALASRKISLLLADDSRLQQLNKDWRDKDAPTNVLSFPAPDLPMSPLGDIAMAWETCLREAQEQGKELRAHVFHLFVHGVLHLLGYDHVVAIQAEEMEGLESRILSGLGMADPWDPVDMESDE